MKNRDFTSKHRDFTSKHRDFTNLIDGISPIWWDFTKTIWCYSGIALGLWLYVGIPLGRLGNHQTQIHGGFYRRGNVAAIWVLTFGASLTPIIYILYIYIPWNIPIMIMGGLSHCQLVESPFKDKAISLSIFPLYSPVKDIIISAVVCLNAPTCCCLNHHDPILHHQVLDLIASISSRKHQIFWPSNAGEGKYYVDVDVCVCVCALWSHIMFHVVQFFYCTVIHIIMIYIYIVYYHIVYHISYIVSYHIYI